MYRTLNYQLGNRKLYGILVIFAAVFMMLVRVSVKAQSADPRFRSEVLTLEGWDLVLSPNGRFVAGSSRHDIDKDQIEVRLWKIDAVQHDNGSMIEPTSRIVLDYRVPEKMISSFEMRFSPDEKFLAIRKDFDLTILTVPDFQIHEQVVVSTDPGVDPGAIRWSPDGMFLATEGSGDLVVWDSQTNYLHRHSLDETWGPIIATDDGWLVLTFMYDERPLSNAFSFCTKLAEECVVYQMERLLQPYVNGQSVVASPDGQMVLTFGQVDVTQAGVWAWQREANGGFVRSDFPLDLGDDVVPLLFSSEGHYLATHGGEAIWDYKTLLQMQVIDTAWDIIAFGPDNEHFVLLEFPEPLKNMRMYRIGHDLPVDIFSISEFLDPDVLEPGISGLTITAGSDWVLVNIRQSGILIPVNYE